MKKIIKKTIKVSILGLDGAGKSTTVSYFTQSFYNEFSIVKLGRSAYYFDRNTNEKKFLFTKLLKRIDNMFERYEKKHSKIGIAIASIFYIIAIRWMEHKVIKKLKPDIIIASRDITIDSLIYVDYYIKFAKYIPKVIKRFIINLFCFFPKKSDLIIFLELDPNESMKRIKKRELKDKIDPSVMRKKSRYRHENIESLIQIANNYNDYLKNYLNKKKKQTIVFVDANKQNTKERTEFCAKVIRSFINKVKSLEK